MDCTMRLKTCSKVRNTKWDWFNARNYCRYDWFSWDTNFMLGSILLFRKRCMDLVSFETRQEYDWVKGFIDGGVNIFRSYI